MANIGNLALKLTADASAFNSVLDQTRGRLEAFGAKAANFASLAAGGPAGIVAKLAGATIGTALIGEMNHLAKELAGVKGQAASAGVSVRQFMELTGFLSPAKTEMAVEGLRHLSRTLADLSSARAAQAAQAESPLGKLPDLSAGANLRAAGLDPAKLGTMGAAEAMKEVARRFHEARDPVERARIAFAAFGKEGVKLTEILDKIGAQPGGIGGKFAGMNPEQIFQADQMQKSLEKADKWWGNFKGKVALGWAETVNSLGDKWNEVFNGARAGDSFLKAREEFEAQENMKRRADETAAAFAREAASAERLKAAFEKIRDLSENLRIAGTATEGVSPHMAEVAKLRETLRGQLTPAEFGKQSGAIEQLFGQAFAQDQKDFAAAVEKTNDQLHNQIATLGMGTEEAKLYEQTLQAGQNGLGNKAGQALLDQASLVAEKRALEDFFATARPGVNLLDSYQQGIAELNAKFQAGEISAEGFGAAFEKLNKDLGKNEAAAWGKTLNDAISPADAFKGKLEELERLSQELGQGTRESLDAAALGALKTFEQLKSSIPGGLAGQAAAPQLLEQGTSAELSAQTKFERQGLAGDVQEQMRRLLEIAQEQRAKQIELGEKILATQKGDTGEDGGGELEF